MIKLQVDGFEKLEKNLTSIGKMSVERMQDIVQKAANVVRDAAKNVVPVDTARLKSSIQVQKFQKETNGAIAEIGPKTDYEQYVEFGTSRQRAQPYMKPGLIRGEDYILGAVKGIIK